MIKNLDIDLETRDKAEDLLCAVADSLGRIADALEKLSACVDDPKGCGPRVVISGLVDAYTHTESY